MAGPMSLLFLALPLAGCGGDGPTPPPPQPPPPPPPPPSGPPPPPAVSFSLAAGEARIVRDADEVRAFQLDGAQGDREYVVVMSSGSQVATAVNPIRLRVRAAGEAAGSVSPAPASSSRSGASRTFDERVEWLRRSSVAELRLKEAVRREIEGLGAPPVPAGGRRARAVQLAVGAAQPPQVGDTLRFKLAVQVPSGDVDCSDTSIKVAGVVRALGDRFALVEDTAVSADVPSGFYTDLIPELDDKVFPVDAAYFGSPADIDGNERVLVLFTKVVNELEVTAGFFFGGDLIDPTIPENQGGCPASNEAELLYLLAADPMGRFGSQVSLTDARRNARRVVAHEFQHLLLAEQRFILGEGTSPVAEDTWLNEGLSHVAEEVSGHAVFGVGTRENLDLVELGVGMNPGFEDFVSFHLGNFLQVNSFYELTHDTQALAEEDPIFTDEEASIRLRGFAWLLLRWIADQFAPAAPSGIVPGSAEQNLFAEIARGGPGNSLSGPQNILAALESRAGVSKTWDDLLAEFSSMSPLDDAEPAGAPAFTQLLTWDLRSVFGDLHEETQIDFSPSGPGGSPVLEPFPLDVVEVVLSGSTNDSTRFDLRSGAQRYLRFQGTDPPDIVVELTTLSGGSLPATARAQVTIVRSR